MAKKYKPYIPKTGLTRDEKRTTSESSRNNDRNSSGTYKPYVPKTVPTYVPQGRQVISPSAQNRLLEAAAQRKADYEAERNAVKIGRPRTTPTSVFANNTGMSVNDIRNLGTAVRLNSATQGLKEAAPANTLQKLTDYSRSEKKYSGMTSEQQSAEYDRLVSARDAFKSNGDDARAAQVQTDIDYLKQSGNTGTRAYIRKKENEGRQGYLDYLKTYNAHDFGDNGVYAYGEENDEDKGYLDFSDPAMQMGYSKAWTEPEIDRTQAQINQYERFQRPMDKYYGLMENEDFETYARPNGASIEDIANASVVNGQSPDRVNDILANPYAQNANNITGQQAELFFSSPLPDVLPSLLNKEDADALKGSWNMMTPDERKIYYYLLNKEGEESARKYLDDMKVVLNRRTTKAIEQEAADRPLIQNIAMSALNIPMSMFGGALAVPAAVANGIKGEEYNPYANSSFAMLLGQGDKQAAQQKIEDGVGVKFLNVGLGDVYGAVMSSVESRLGAMLGGGGWVYSILMGMSSAVQQAKELYERGASPEQIAAGSILTGAAEVVFEEISMDKLIKLQDSASIRQMIRNILASAFVEGSEEFNTSIADMLTDAIVMRNESEYNVTVRKYMEQGMSEQEAMAKALEEQAGEVWQSFIGGFLSGGMFGISGNVQSLGTRITEAANTGRTIQESGNTENVVALANKRAEEMRNRDGNALERLANRVAARSLENRANRTIRQSDRGRTDRGSYAYNLGRLSQNLNEQTAKFDAEYIKKELVLRGVKNASEVAQAFAKSLNGQELNNEEKISIVENAKAVQEVQKQIETGNAGDVSTHLAQNAVLNAAMKMPSLGISPSEVVSVTGDAYKRGKEYKIGDTTISIDSISDGVARATVNGRSVNTLMADTDSEEINTLLEYAGKQRTQQRAEQYIEGYIKAKENGLNLGQYNLAISNLKKAGFNPAKELKDVVSDYQNNPYVQKLDEDTIRTFYFDGEEQRNEAGQESVSGERSSTTREFSYEIEEGNGRHSEGTGGETSRKTDGVVEGLKGYSRDEGVTEVKEEDLSKKDKKAVAKYKGKVKNIRFWKGGAVYDATGASVRGMYDEETGTLYVRTDHKELSVEQILRHEFVHDVFSADRTNLLNVFRDIVLKTYTQESIKKMVYDYAQRYNWLDENGKLPKTIEVDGETYNMEDYILEEIACDAYAEINIFKGSDLEYIHPDGVTKFKSAVESMIRRAERGNIKANERNYSLAELEERHPDGVERVKAKELNSFKDVPFISQKNLVSAALKQVAKNGHYKNNKDASYVTFTDGNQNAKVTADSFRHGNSDTSEEYKLACMNFTKIAEKAIAVNELNPNDRHSNSSTAYMAVVDSARSSFVVRIIVSNGTGEVAGMNVVYAVKKENLLGSPASATAQTDTQSDAAPARLKEIKKFQKASSKLTIREFLDVVKDSNLAKTTLSADVLGKLGVERQVDDMVTPFLRASREVPTLSQTVGNPANEVKFSREFNDKYMDNAEKANGKFRDLLGRIHKVDEAVTAQAREVRDYVKKYMDEHEKALGLPDDITGKTMFGNASYGYSNENTTICPRSLTAEEFLDKVSEKLGRPLTQEEAIYVAQEAAAYVHEAQCLYCYVAMDRAANRGFLLDYIKQRDAALKSIGKEAPNTSSEAYKQFLGDRKDTSVMKDRWNHWMSIKKNGGTFITAEDVASEENMKKAVERDPSLAWQISDASKYARAASWEKKKEAYRAYDNSILKWKADRIKKLNNMFGLRMYSFSDFSPAFILENMQVITDASVVGLKVLAYTKRTDFAEIFAPTGANINISCFGYRQNGQVAIDEMYGANVEEAKALRDKYPNVGITFTATDDAMVEWALKQDWIDVVIPFHLVRTGQVVADLLQYTDFKSVSSDKKDADWAKGNAKEIYPNVHQNNIDKYLKALEKNHLRPRFEKWTNEHLEGGVRNPNYMKLVNETRLSADESQIVKPVFNTGKNFETINNSFQWLEDRGGYYQHVGGSVEAMESIAEDTARNVENGGVEKMRQFKKAVAESNAVRDSRDTDTPKISVGMSDAVRAEILAKKTIVPAIYKGQADAVLSGKDDFSDRKKSFITQVVKRAVEQFGLPSEVFNEDMEIQLKINKTSIWETISKGTADTGLLIKLLPVIDDAVKNAIGIEAHANRYYYDDSTKLFVNLFGCIEEGKYVTPVLFGIKSRGVDNNTLRIIIGDEKINKSEVVTDSGNEAHENARSDALSLHKIAHKVNTKDIIKYLPDEFLSDSRKQVKREAIAETIKKTNNKNDKHYADYIRKGDKASIRRMIKAAAQNAMSNSKVVDENGNLLKMYHGTNEYFTAFDRDYIGATGRFEGSGFNFTPSRDRAASYGEVVREGYLNISNPLAADKKTISVGKLAQLIREADPTGDNIISDYARETRDYGQPSFIRREALTAARSIWDASESDVDIYSFISAADSDAESLIQKFEDMEYDGLIHYYDDGRIKTAVAFSSSQFKLADDITYDNDGNIVPISERFRTDRTGEDAWKNNDMRFSRDTSLERYASEPMMKVIDYVRHNIQSYGIGHVSDSTLKNYVDTWFYKNGVKVEPEQWNKLYAMLRTLRDANEKLSKTTDIDASIDAYNEYQNLLENDLTDIVKDLLVNSPRLDVENEEYNRAISESMEKVKKWFNKYPIYFNEVQRQELASHYGSYARAKEILGKARNNPFGIKIQFSGNSAYSLDSNFSEIQELLKDAYAGADLDDASFDEGSEVDLILSLVDREALPTRYVSSDTYYGTKADEEYLMTINDAVTESVMDIVNDMSKMVKKAEPQGVRIAKGIKNRKTVDAKTKYANDQIEKFQTKLTNLLEEARKEMAARYRENLEAVKRENAREIEKIRSTAAMWATDSKMIGERLTAARKALAEAEAKHNADVENEKLRTDWLVAKQKHEDKINALIKQKKELDKQKKRLAERYKRLKDEALTKQKAAIYDAVREREQRKRKADERRGYIDSIRKTAGSLKTLLARPTDQKHINDSMRPYVEEVLKYLDFDRKNLYLGKEVFHGQVWEKVDGKYVKVEEPTLGETYYAYVKGQYVELKWNVADLVEARMWRDAMSKLNAEFGKSEFYDEDLIARITDFVDKTAGVVYIRNLNNAQLKELSRIIKAVKTQVQNEGRFTSIQRTNSVAELAHGFADPLLKREARYYNGQKDNAKMNAFDRYFNFDRLDALSFFKKLGPEAEEIYHALRNGFNDYVFAIREDAAAIQQMLDETGLTREDLDKVVTISLTDKNAFGEDIKKEIKLTKGQLMKLYTLSNRRQALNHILNGGIIPTTITEKGKKIHQKKITLANENLDSLFSNLSEKEIELADKIQRYESTVLSARGNKASVAAFGYSKFTEEFYSRIKVDKHSKQNQTQESEQRKNDGMWSIKNMGITKQLQDDASNAIYVDNILDDYVEHATQMASYYAYLNPLMDAMKWYNYSANKDNIVQRAMDEQYGSGASAYFEQLIRDINGYKESEAATDFWHGTFVKNAKIASVGLNLSVVVQQPSAYFRAIDVIPAKYLHDPRAALRRGGMKKFTQYSAIGQWKEWGYFELYNGKSTREVMLGTDLKGKIKDKFTWLAGKADAITWGTLWNACELWVEDTTTLKKDTDEFYAEVAKRFDQVIDETQVVDSVFHRSQDMRSKKGILPIATAFLSEPTKSFNILYRNINDVARQSTTRKIAQETIKKLKAERPSDSFRAEEIRKEVAENEAIIAKCTEGMKKAVPKVARGFVGIMASNIVAGALQALIGTLRKSWGGDDDDETFWNVYLETAFEDIVQNINPLNWMPFIKGISSDLLNVEQNLWRVFNGERWKIGTSSWNNSSLDNQALSKTVTVLTEAFNSITNMSGQKGLYKIAYDAAQALSYITGVPIGALWRDVQAFAKLGAKEPIEKLEKGIYNPTGYVTAMKNGNTKKAENILNRMRKMKDSNGAVKYSEKGLRDQIASELAKDFDIIRAARFKKDGSYSKMYDIYDRYTAMGFDADTVDKAINNAENADKNGQKDTLTNPEGEYYSKIQEAVNAKLEGNTDRYDEIVDLLAMEFDKKAIQSAITSEMPDNTDVKLLGKEDYIKAYNSGEDLDRITAELKADGYDEEDFAGWISGINTDNLHEALGEGDVSSANKYLAEIKEQKGDSKNAITGIKNSLTNWVKKWIETTVDSDKANDYYAFRNSEQFKNLAKVMSQVDLFDAKNKRYYSWSKMCDILDSIAQGK